MDEEQDTASHPTPSDFVLAEEWLYNKLRAIEKEEDWMKEREPFRIWCQEQVILIYHAERTYVWEKVEKRIQEERKGFQVGEDKIQVQTWEEIEKFEFPKNKWRIHNILPKSGLVLVAAISGERKSWFVFEMLNALSKVRNFLHDKQFVTEGCNVLYIDGELGPDQVQQRGKMLGFNEKRDHKMYFIDGSNLNFNDPDRPDLYDVIEFVNTRNVKVVVIDTFRAVAGGMKEEKAEEVRAFFKRFQVFKEIGVCVVFLDHFRKPSHLEGKTPKKEHVFASQDKVSNMEVLLMLKTEPGTEITSVYQRKNRLGREIPPFNFRMEDTDIDSENNKITVIYDGELDVSVSKPEEAKGTIIEVLTEGPKTRKELLDIVYKRTKIASRTTSDAYRELESKGIIITTKRGRENVYTLNLGPTGDVDEKNSGNDDGNKNTDTTLPLNDL